jgi:hypothetical protein
VQHTARTWVNLSWLRNGVDLLTMLLALLTVFFGAGNARSPRAEPMVDEHHVVTR